MKFRILAALAMLSLSAPSALGVQCALSPTRGELAGWLAALGIELAYLSLAFIKFDGQQRQRSAARVAKTAVATAITLNVLADYAARVPAGLTNAAVFLTTFDWLLLALSVLESAPLAGLAYTLAVLLHTRSSKQHPAVDAQQMLSTAEQHQQQMLSIQQQIRSSAEYCSVDAEQIRSSAEYCSVDAEQMLSTAEQHQQHQQYTAQYTAQHTSGRKTLL